MLRVGDTPAVKYGTVSKGPNVAVAQKVRVGGSFERVLGNKVSTGAPVWRHRDATRFWESNGGAGPRGTPTLSGSRVYALGATGILNALDAGSGAVVWSRNAAADTHAKLPGWGFASSPLVVDDVVISTLPGERSGVFGPGHPRTGFAP